MLGKRNTCSHCSNSIVLSPRKRSCHRCGKYYCGKCKRECMMHLGWRLWLCKDGCKDIPTKNETTLETISISNILITVHEASEISKNVSRPSVMIALEDEDGKLRAASTPTCKVRKNIASWQHQIKFRIPSQSIKDLNVKITLRDEIKRGGLMRAHLNVGMGCWPWELKFSKTATNWIPLQNDEGYNVGRIKLSIVVQSEKKRRNPLQRRDTEIPTTPATLSEDEEGLKIEDEDEIRQTEHMLIKKEEKHVTPSSSVLQSVLLKRSRWRRRWNERHFVLKGNVLLHYEKKNNEPHENPLGSRVLSLGDKIKKIDHPISEKHSPPKGWFEFEVKPHDSVFRAGGESMHLAAPSEASRNMWIRSLRRAVNGACVVGAQDHSFGIVVITVRESDVPKKGILGGNEFVAVVELEDVSTIVPTNAGTESTVRIPVSDPTSDIVVRLKHSNTHHSAGHVICPVSMLTNTLGSDKAKKVSGWFRLLPSRSGWNNRKYLPGVQGKLGTGLSRPSRYGWVRLDIELQLKAQVNVSMLYLTQPIHKMSKWPRVPSKYSTEVKYRLKERLTLFHRRPRRWLLHVRDLKNWRRPGQTLCLVAVLCIVIMYSEIWHIPVILGLGLAFLSLLSTVPHEKEKERNIFLWNDELENRQRTLWGKLWHVADVLGRVQRLIGRTLTFLEKLENSLTWDDPHVSIVALLLVGLVTSIVGALLQLMCILYDMVPIRMVGSAVVILYFVPITKASTRSLFSKRLRETTSSYISRTKGMSEAALILDEDDEDDEDHDRVVRYSTKLFTKGHSLPIWKRRRFKLYKDRISYWDVNTHSDEIPKYSMRLDDVTDLKSLKSEANMSRFELQARLSKGTTASWIIGCTDERICSLWMSAIRIQKQRLELRARIKRENEESSSISSSQSGGGGELRSDGSTSSSTPVHFLKTLIKVTINMLHQWWDRIPHHDEIIHRKIARSQLQTDTERRLRSSSADSEVESENEEPTTIKTEAS